LSGGTAAAESAPSEARRATAAKNEVPVVAARKSVAQPNASEGVEPGIKFSARITAATGGPFSVPGGAPVAIPAGSLVLAHRDTR
jgi:hypothetical protein